MSKLCKFTFKDASFLVDPDLVERVEEDLNDETCLLHMKDGETRWVDGLIDDIQETLNDKRTC